MLDEFIEGIFESCDEADVRVRIVDGATRTVTAFVYVEGQPARRFSRQQALSRNLPEYEPLFREWGRALGAELARDVAQFHAKQ